jgi:hypothetical protein
VSGNARSRRKSQPGLDKLYWQKCVISAAKKKDLVALCDALIIEPEHHDFYAKIMVDREAKDRLPKPDVLESDQDTDLE